MFSCSFSFFLEFFPHILDPPYEDTRKRHKYKMQGNDTKHVFRVKRPSVMILLVCFHWFVRRVELLQVDTVNTGVPLVDFPCFP